MDHDMSGHHSMGGSPTTNSTVMNMPTGSEAACKISMLWNWYRVDSCFIASSWHIRTKGMFAGSCIGVILLVMALELVRRGQREYERYISQRNGGLGSPGVRPDGGAKETTGTSEVIQVGPGGLLSWERGPRPSFVQQLIRSAIYMVQFGMGYFVMLLAMYYNGYFIICILIGAFLGHYVFAYDTLSLRGGQETGTSRSCC